MRVFWITTSLPHPAGSAGCALEYDLIAAQANDHDVHVLSTQVADPLGEGALREIGVTYSPVRSKVEPHPTSKLGVARVLLRADPSVRVWLERDRIPALVRAVEEASAELGPPDVVQITHGELAPVAARITAPTGLLLFDANSLALESRRAVEPLARRRLQLCVEARRTRRYERRWYPRATGIASNSLLDAQWTSDLVGRPVTTIENPIGERFFEPPECERNADMVALVASLAHVPNVDAIEWMVADIWPRVRAARPTARLVVAGRGDPEGRAESRLRPLVERAGGELRVDLEDIRPVYWEAAVAVAPVRQGAGVRNKVLHAMACGAPLVATPSAVEGIRADVRRNVRIAPADDAATFARTVLDVLDDPDAASRSRTAVASLAPLRMSVIGPAHERWWRSLATAQGGHGTESESGADARDPDRPTCSGGSQVRGGTVPADARVPRRRDRR